MTIDAARNAMSQTTRKAESGLPATVGLMQIGPAKVALPIASIREVVEGLPNYGVLPIKAEGLLGAIDIRGTIVPVLDLRPSLGWPSDAATHVVMILRCDGFLLGLRADAVFGVVQIQPGDLCDLTATGPRPVDMLATHAYDCGDGIVTILDPGRIVDRPGVPKVLEKIEHREIATARSETVLLFSHGRSHLGIDSDCIDAAIPDAVIDKNALSVGFCLGTIEHRGFNVPVIDTMVAVGSWRGSRTPISTSTVIVIRFGAKTMLAFAVDAVRDIVPVTSDAILAMPAMTRNAESLFRGMLLAQEEPHHLLLDLERLRRDPELIDLASLCRPQPRLQVAETGGGPRVTYERAERFIVYMAGGEFATRLVQITEILPFPTDVAPYVDDGSGILNLFVHRRRLMPLICMQHCLTHRHKVIDEANARVLFVEAGDRSAGFVVETLESIDIADPEQWSASRRGGQTSLMGFPFVILGDQRRMVSHIDLVALLDQVYGARALDGSARGDIADRIRATA